MPKITLKTVKALPVTGEDVVHWDDEKKGFGLRVTANGTKSYLIKYRTRRADRGILPSASMAFGRPKAPGPGPTNCCGK
jgi:hypothetical protein